MNETRTAWHYTVDDRARNILALGLIVPAITGVPENERPCVWFSVHPMWEPTASKAELFGGNTRALSFEEMQELGLWRFGLPVTALIGWKKIPKTSRMSRRTVRTLERVGRDKGANPLHWYAALNPVPVADCIVQRLIDGRWQTAGDPAGR
jgi:hypothetical protein